MPSFGDALGGSPLLRPRETAAPALVPFLRLDPFMGGLWSRGRASAPDSVAVRWGSRGSQYRSRETFRAGTRPFLPSRTGRSLRSLARGGGIADLFGPCAFVLADPRSPRRGVLRQYASSPTRPDLGKIYVPLLGICSLQLPRGPGITRDPPLGPARRDSKGLGPARRDSKGLGPARRDSKVLTPARRGSKGLGPATVLAAGMRPRRLGRGF